MAEVEIDLARWPRAAQFHLFRSYAKPHYAITTRLDLSHVMTRKADGLSPYRACLYAIGTGLHRTEALRLRFRGDRVLRHDAVEMSMTVPRESGAYGLGYLRFEPDFHRFDAAAEAEIDRVKADPDLNANQGERDDLAYLSCLPWLDYTSLDNALPGPEDCIPRIGWGKIVEQGGRFDMAMTVEAHHALVDGADMGAFFIAVQDALNSL